MFELATPLRPWPVERYANLEVPDQRDFAESDPRGFLAQLGEGPIIDEIQHVPELLSYLQVLAGWVGSATSRPSGPSCVSARDGSANCST